MVTPAWTWRARFLLSYLSGDRASAGPFAAAIDVTRRCNLQCFGCPSHAPDARWHPNRQDNDFSWNDYQRVCEELRRMGTRKLILIGEGEPTLHPKLLDMIFRAKRCGFYVTLLTNGTTLDERLAPALATSGLDELRVSLWASDEDEFVHNYSGTNPDFFRRVLDGSRAVARARRAAGRATPRIVLHRPIDREHFRNLERMVDVAREAECDELSFSPLKPMGAAAIERALTPLEVGELRTILGRVGSLARSAGLACNDAAALERYRIGSDVWTSFPCYLAWLDVRIRSNGDVQVCAPCRQSMGNVRESSLAEIWNDEPYRTFRRQARTRAGLGAMAQTCNCGYCCHVLTNARLHRLLRWVPRLG